MDIQIKYIHQYKKPSILFISKESIPDGMTEKDISDLFDKSEPIPYVGETKPHFADTPDEIIKRLNPQKIKHLTDEELRMWCIEKSLFLYSIRTLVDSNVREGAEKFFKYVRMGEYN
jgi:hypothetical protein